METKKQITTREDLKNTLKQLLSYLVSQSKITIQFELLSNTQQPTQITIKILDHRNKKLYEQKYVVSYLEKKGYISIEVLYESTKEIVEELLESHKILQTDIIKDLFRISVGSHDPLPVLPEDVDTTPIRQTLQEFAEAGFNPESPTVRIKIVGVSTLKAIQSYKNESTLLEASQTRRVTGLNNKERRVFQAILIQELENIKKQPLVVLEEPTSSNITLKEIIKFIIYGVFFSLLMYLVTGMTITLKTLVIGMVLGFFAGMGNRIIDLLKH